MGVGLLDDVVLVASTVETPCAEEVIPAIPDAADGSEASGTVDTDVIVMIPTAVTVFVEDREGTTETEAGRLGVDPGTTAAEVYPSQRVAALHVVVTEVDVVAMIISVVRWSGPTIVEVVVEGQSAETTTACMKTVQSGSHTSIISEAVPREKFMKMSRRSSKKAGPMAVFPRPVLIFCAWRCAPSFVVGRIPRTRLFGLGDV